MKIKIQPKPEFIEKMKKLLSQADFEKYERIIQEPLLNSIRCNTLKISPEELKKRLEEKGWKISQPWKEHPEIMIVGNELQPGELGRSIEHLLGYYYIQELASMLSIIALAPKQNELILDLCASPGSKTTQLSMIMKDQGLIIANDNDYGRLNSLMINLQRCGCYNTIINLMQGRLIKGNFDKILVDAPCSGTGIIRKSLETIETYNPNAVRKCSGIQRQLILTAFDNLKEDGTLVYSTCSLEPEENEEVIDFLIKNRNCRTEKIDIDIKRGKPIEDFEGKTYSKEVKNCLRIWPQDNDTEGFFVAKIIKR